MVVEIGVKMRKVVILTAKGCYRSICNHLFLLGVLCFLILLYRLFPFVFSILVSASPVLVCTAVLLGSLLSFGQPNIPEIEKEERITREVVSLKTGLLGDAAVVERSERCLVERYSDQGRDAVGKSTDKMGLVADGIGKIGPEVSFDGTGKLTEEWSWEMQFDDGFKDEPKRELHGYELEQKNDMFELRLGDIKTVENQYSLISEVDDDHLELENDRSPVGSMDSKVVNVDSLDSPPWSPWKHVDEGEEEDGEDDDTSDSGSDRAESSSPDASMSDILPMLDELHPLLDEDAPLQANLSHDGSDAASESSARSSDSHSESDDDTENQEEFEVVDNDNEHAVDGEETLEDQTKSAITWTEDDQRNLMDLGSSELERNRRLENLIAKRRAGKTMNMMMERNLIDLESADLPFNLPPITTTRTNPFNLKSDSYENMGLPPIPGSAPSVLLARLNPFDLPYDSSEEKPDLMGDNFQQEFLPSQSKEPFFRRHESFNVRPSLFRINRPVKQDFTHRPYFVPEQMDSEGSSYSPFQRQSSELSDSKESSSPDMESIDSAGDLEERNPTEEDTFVAEITNLTQEDMSQDTYEAEVGNDTEEDTPQEPHLISMIEHAPENVGHGSESSEEDNTSEFGQVEKRNVEVDEIGTQLRDVENHHVAELSLVAGQSIVDPLEVSIANSVVIERRYGGVSSSSSLSEESERIYAEKEVEGFPTFVEGGYLIEEPSISPQPSLQGWQMNPTTASPDGTLHREPVYDSSPTSLRRDLSSSSISSDLHVESESGFLHVVVKRSVSFVGRVSELRSQDMDNDSLVDKEMLAGSSEIHYADKSETESRGDAVINGHDFIPVNREILAGSLQENSADGNEMRSIEGVELNEHDIIQDDVSAVDEISYDTTAPVVLETVHDHTVIDAKSAGGSLQKENHMDKDMTSQHARGSDADTHVPAQDTVRSRPSDEQTLARSDESQRSGVEQVSPVQFDTLSSRSQSTAGHITDGDSFHHEGDEMLTSSDYQHPMTEKFVSLSAENVVLPDKSMYEPPEDPKEALLQEPVTVVESLQEVSTTDNWNYYEAQEFHNEVSPDLGISTGREFIWVQSEVYETQALAVDEMNEVMEFDEEFLSELDTVGDFPIKESGKHGDHLELSGQILSAQHEANSFSSNGLVEGSSTQTHETKYAEHTENIDAKNCDVDVKSGTSAVEQIDLRQYNQKEVGIIELRSTEVPKEKKADAAENILKHISDAEEAHYAMPEIEARSDIESISLTSSSVVVETEVLRNPEPSHVEPSLEDTVGSCSKDAEMGRASSQSKVMMETPTSEEKMIKDFVDFDLNQLPQENID